MGSKKSSRLKRAAQRIPRIKAALGNGQMLKDGQELVSGTPEHERHLMIIATRLSEEELRGMEAINT